MALIDEVKSRIPTQKLAELTNLNDISVKTIDDPRLQLAVDDAEAEFKVRVGVVYDNDDARHKNFAIIGVVRILQLDKLESTAIKNYEDWHKALERLRLVTGNNRILPKSSSEKTPAKASPGGELVRPLFDVNDGFTDIIPEQRSGVTRRTRGLPN